jgi:cbb3-type cytochrome oxidase subunit 3
MEATSAAVLMTLALALVLFGTSYYYLTTRHKERLALLEKGLSPTAFHRPGAYLPLLLLLGILCLGLATGIAAGAFLRALPLANSQEYAYPVAIFFFLGVSLVVAYYVLRTLPPRA